MPGKKFRTGLVVQAWINVIKTREGRHIIGKCIGVMDLQDMPNSIIMKQSLSADFDTNIRNLRILLNLPKNEDVKFRE